MSYENSECPCGGEKECGTMLCIECVEHLRGHAALAAFENQKLSLEARRHAAVILCACARARGRAQAAKKNFPQRDLAVGQPDKD